MASIVPVDMTVYQVESPEINAMNTGTLAAKNNVRRSMLKIDIALLPPSCPIKKVSKNNIRQAMIAPIPLALKLVNAKCALNNFRINSGGAPI